jgi:ABC-type enterobactin transport system permease subunit
MESLARHLQIGSPDVVGFETGSRMESDDVMDAIYFRYVVT